MKIQSIIAIAAIATVSSLNAQTIKQPVLLNQVRITPVQAIWGKTAIGYEHAIAPKTTMNIEAQKWFEDYTVSTGWLLIGVSDKIANQGFRVSAGMRFYKTAAFHGLYGEAAAFTGRHTITTTSTASFLFIPLEEETKTYRNVFSSGVKAGVGYMITKGHFSFDLGLGIGAAACSNDAVTENVVNGVFTTSRLAIGVSF